MFFFKCQDETEFHLFCSCIKVTKCVILLYVFNVQINWVFFALGAFEFIFVFDFRFLTAQHSHSQLIIIGIVFLLNATKYRIWTHRNNIVHNKVNFDSDCTIEEFKNMLFSRRRIENYELNKKHSQILKLLCNALIY